MCYRPSTRHLQRENYVIEILSSFIKNIFESVKYYTFEDEYMFS